VPDDGVLSGVFQLPFPEQIAAFRLRLGNLVPTARWDDIEGQAHDRAFMVAGAMKAELLADLAAAVDRGIAGGGTLDDFRRDFRAIVARHGWHGWTGEGTKAGEAWRTRVIWRTNMATTWAAGRRAQLEAGNFAFWVYRHGGSREPRPQHLAWDGLALPPGHPFWATHAPPNGWGCSCKVYGARSEKGVRRLGGDPDKALPPGWDARDPRTGAPPGIDKGWAHAPGATVAGQVQQLARKIAALPAPLGSALGDAAAAQVARAWPAWLAAVRSGRREEPALVGTLSQEVLKPLAAQGVEPTSAEIMVHAGLLLGPKADRHARDGDALTEADWERMPMGLRSPSAVLLDVRTGALLYVFPAADGTAQIAVRLDYRTRIARRTETVNMVVSAYRIRPVDLAARLAGGLVALIAGSIQ
jgi:hypothetical protein